MKQSNNDPSSKLEAAKNIAKSKKRITVFEGVEDVILRVFRFFSAIIDRIFFSQKYLSLFALALAVFLYLGVASSDNSIISNLSSAKTLNNISVSAKYNSESFEVSGVPNACQIIITGEAANVNNAATRNGYCLLNLEGYTEGTHTIELKAMGYGDNVTTTVTPSETQITLKKKTTGQFELTYAFNNSDLMDARYILGTPVFDNGNKINIRASQDTLNSIARVVAQIDVTGVTSDFTVAAPLVAYDSYGKVVEAEIVPNTVQASVKVYSPNKIVPISLKTSGSVKSEQSVKAVKMDQQSVTIYGPQSVLDEIEEVNVSLDLSTIQSDTVIEVPIALPEGVVAADIAKVNLTISLSETATKTLQDIPIMSRNNVNNYGVTDNTITSVDVTLSGSADIISNITASMIEVYVDFEGLEPGNQNLQLHVASNNLQFVNYTLSVEYINLTLVVKE